MLLATLMFVSVNAIVKWLSDSLATPQILFARYAFQLLLLVVLMRGGFVRALAILGTVAHFALIRAFTVAEASVVAPFRYSNLLWSVLFGIVLFADVPDAWILAGAALIAAGGLSIIHAERREKGAG